MRNLIRSCGVACFALLLSVSVAHAVDIDLRNADNSRTPLASTGAQGAADTSLKTCFGGDSHCTATDPNSYLKVRAASVFTVVGITDVTTDTTSAAFTIPAGAKTPVGYISGTGAISGTVTLFGKNDTVASDGILLCTISLTGTTVDTKGCTEGKQFTADYKYYYITTASTSGTGATYIVEIYVGLAGSGAAGAGGGDASAANQSTMITALQLIDNLAVDPCGSTAKIFVPISQTTGTQILTGTASNRTYVCQLTLSTATTQNFALVSGTGSVCATSTAAMIGGTTAATGFIASANWAIVLGDGKGTVAKSTVDANNVCILMSSTGQLSGVLSYVVAPN